jgi:hypothetical protein
MTEERLKEIEVYLLEHHGLSDQGLTNVRELAAEVRRLRERCARWQDACEQIVASRTLSIQPAPDAGEARP